MGEQKDWVRNVGLNGLRPGEQTDSIFQVLDDKRWLIAEERIVELIACIKPTAASDQHRIAVSNYVQNLIMQCVQCQVLAFGSVPLKTYLPDGDIDLTTYSWTLDLNDPLPTKVCNILVSEEKNENAEFRVQEVQFIDAEVKIVKCLVENIVVDISFNQFGGICTLCMLEEADRIISDNHLFKRSIILIKAWCYYESRILGAHHGLISTYALEILVLYIFHVFNNSFKGPLEVLYRFLEFFSKFDWENFCVSLWGPVPLSSLPEIIVEPPRKDSRQLLFDKAFLAKCTHFYGYNSQQEQIGTLFPKRSLNVVDPLRLNNNLGRSVSKGNFFRIRSAFAFGALKLARLLDCPEENLYFEVNQFFSNTWQRHGIRICPDGPFKVPKSVKPPTPDSFKGTSQERKESSSAEAKNASAGRHDNNAAKGHARQTSSGTNSQSTRNHSSLGIADVAQGPFNASFSSDGHSSVCSASDYAANSEVSSSSYQNIRVDDHTFMFHGFNGHFSIPLNVPSRHQPFVVPHSALASLSSHPKNMEENPWAMNMQFMAIPPSTTNYFHGVGMPEMKEGLKPADFNLLDVENKVWHDHEWNSFEGFDSSNGTSEVSFDDISGRHESIAQNYQLPCIELPSKIGMETGTDHVSEEIATDNPQVSPFRFIPAGSPVPFLTKLPLHSVPNRTGTVTKTNVQIAECEEPGRAESRRWDAFDSNTLAHLQILMYARSCQALQNDQRLGLPSQFTRPNAHCVPSDCSVRPLPPNINQFAPFTGSDGRYIPVAPPVASMPIRPLTDYQPRVEEMPRYRGTGTYFPNPEIQKNSVRDRKCSGNGRANYSYYRNNQQRNQYDKSCQRIPRSFAGEIDMEKSWRRGSYRRPDAEFAFQSQVDSLHPPTSSSSSSSHDHVSTDEVYDIYSLPACSDVKGGSYKNLYPFPSLMMMHPLCQKLGYTPQPQAMEFRSFGSIDLPGMKGGYYYSLAQDPSRHTRVPEYLQR